MFVPYIQLVSQRLHPFLMIIWLLGAIVIFFGASAKLTLEWGVSSLDVSLLFKVCVIKSKSDIFRRWSISNCIFLLRREVVGVIVSVLTNVNYQIVCINSRKLSNRVLSSMIIFVANLLRSNMMTFVFLMILPFLEYLTLLSCVRLRNSVNLKFGIIEDLCLGIIGINWAVPLVGLSPRFSFHASNVTPSAQDTLS